MKANYLKELNIHQTIEIMNVATSCIKGMAPEIAGVSNVRTESPASGKVLSDLISGLSSRAREELAALYWLGRKAEGENASDWHQLVKNARAFQIEVDYLCGKLNLGECVADGLMELGYRQ
jgi:hypothetical protein